MKDLTKGYPAKVIALFAIPLIIGNIAQTLYNITDSKIVSLFVSSSALAAVGATGVISNLLIGLMNGLTQGFAIVVSRCFGAKDFKNLRRTVFGIFILTSLFAVALMALGLFTVEPILNLLGTPADIMEDSVSYLRIILVGIIFTAFYNMAANILRAIGDSKRPLYCLFASIIINVGLDLLFIVVFKMGIEGAAYATIISQFLSAVFCLLILVIKTREILPRAGEFDLKLEEYKELITFGLSMGLMGCLINIGSVILQTSINGLGTTVITAHTSARRVLDILMILVYTFGFSMMTFSSQNYGAGRIDRIRQGIIHSVVIDTVITTVIIVWTFMFGTNVVGWVASTQEPAILSNGELYLRIGVVFFYSLGPLFIFRGTLQGMGAKSVPLITSGIELLIKILSVRFLVPVLGYKGVALTEPISWVVMTVFLFIGIVMTLRREMKKMQPELLKN